MRANNNIVYQSINSRHWKCLNILPGPAESNLGVVNTLSSSLAAPVNESSREKAKPRASFLVNKL